MKPGRIAIGKRQEARAERHLGAQGLKLVCRNYACRGGEVDLVMLDQAVLVFVEVRFRSAAHFGGAAASVTRTKQLRIIRAAKHFLRAYPQHGARHCRFDVVAIDGTWLPRIRWIQHAFTV